MRTRFALLKFRTALAALMLGAVLPATPARAHAILLESTPASGVTVPPGPHQIALRFNSRIDPARSRLTVLGVQILGAQGAQDNQGALPLTQPGPAELAASVTLAPGRTVLRWQVLAIDGHVTRGDLVFTVAAP